jgi:hypothetical protein
MIGMTERIDREGAGKKSEIEKALGKDTSN